MEKTNKFNLGKLIFLCIVIIIPIVAAGFICSYSYKRYENTYFQAYWEKTLAENEDDTKAQFESYLKYVSHAYTLYQTEEIEVNDSKAFDLNVYRVIYKEVDEDKNENFNVKYYFMICNLDYKVINDYNNTGLDSDEQKVLTAEDLPSIYFNMYDVDTINNPNSADSKVFSSTNEPIIFDWKATPVVDETEKHTALNEYAFMYWVECSEEALSHYSTYSKDVNIRLHVDNDAKTSASKTIRKNLIFNATSDNEFNTLTLNDFYTKADQLEEYNSETKEFSGYVSGYSENIIKAGYKSYVWSTYIWWQALIALVLIGAVTISFFFVWYFEEDENKGVKVTSIKKKTATKKTSKK